MDTKIIELKEDVSSSSLYSEDLAPVSAKGRTWGIWDLAALWVGMAVCIPTYLLASYMISSGVSWYAALIIIGLANLIITVPMVLNGHAGVKYGIPFPVVGRAAFGIRGIHIPAVVRAIVACGWFGIQTWIGGLAFYAIWNVLTGEPGETGLSVGKFVGFGLFWLVNIYFVWKGTESIRWLEDWSAPILILMGVFLIGWGAWNGGGFSNVLRQGRQLEKPSVSLQIEDPQGMVLQLNPLTLPDGKNKASQYRMVVPTAQGMADLGWQILPPAGAAIVFEQIREPQIDIDGLTNGSREVQVQFRAPVENGFTESSLVTAKFDFQAYAHPSSKGWGYVLWLTAMVGFWATMSISISDITRYARSQKQQVAGQFIGLPGTMILYSFVGIFVTCAAVVNFPDILIGNDAPWDPVSLIARFDNPWVVVVAQLFMIIATLSTNIAANVIAPANVFSNLFPKQLDFRKGGLVTGIIGILICPWWLMNEISNLLLFVSGLLGPVLGVLICDYFVIRKRELRLAELYKENGVYVFTKGYNLKALAAVAAGVLVALVGLWVPALAFLYSLSWFTGFGVAFLLYWGLMEK
ncbi:MAG: NCS1 family nucleobase:cation symporter-1 [Bacteroidia bacterium]|nr:NCS1 family nucleobase:cation symporter-1 [Bacteroidia bacterium]